MALMAAVVLTVSAAARNNPLSLLSPPLTELEINFLKGDPVITHKVTFEITQRKIAGDKVIGDLTLGLFGTVVPNTVKNFVHLANMTYGYGYNQSKFHRIIYDFMIQGGDYENGAGTGGRSIFGGQFKDENFDLKHNKVGRLLMANSGPNTNGAQFFITNVKETSWLNGKHVVFGQLIGGFDVLHKVSYVEVDNALLRPYEDVIISNITVTVMTDHGSTTEMDSTVSHDTPVYEEVVPPEPHVYMYMMVFLVVLCGLFYYNHWYHKKQYITDIKDSAYF